MGWFTDLTGMVAPMFIIASPILSYSDQALSMQRNRSSAGFSLDIPLIMLVASFLRIFYWPGARFDPSLLVQSVLMVGMQLLLLKIALENRPSPTKGADAGLPFAGAATEGIFGGQRPYNFWQWRSPKPYWQFLMYMFAGLIACELVLAWVPPVYTLYSSLIGILGLSIEATLPIPQILANSQSRSCKGFRLSVLASWLIGDTMKIFWFFTATSDIPTVFKVCGIFQASCDAFLGVQYWMYGDGPHEVKEHIMAEAPWQQSGTHGASPTRHQGMRAPSRSLTPTRRPAPFNDLKEID